MAVYLVAYDLLADESRGHYRRVASAITACGRAAEIQRSVWIVRSSASHEAVLDNIGRQLDVGDRIVVAPFDQAACRRLPASASQLLEAAGFLVE